MALELASLDRNKVLNGKTQLPRVLKALQQLGFTLRERPNRSPVGYFGVPQWFYNATGDGSGYYNIRQLCDSALFQWEKYVNPTIVTVPVLTIEDAAIEPEPLFYDDSVSPVFGSTGTGTAESLELMESELTGIEPPKDTVITARMLTTNGGMNGRATLEILAANDSRIAIGSTIESHLSTVKSYSVGSVLECKANVFAFAGTVSVEIMAVNSQLAAPVVATATILLTVKVVNPTGKFEIVESSHSNLVPVGKTYNSTFLGQKQLGSLWLANAHLSQGDSGSLKIDSIEPFERAATIAISPTVAAIPVPVVNTPTIAPKPLQSPENSVSSNEPEPNRTITANMDEWLCSDYYISPNARLVCKMAVNCLKQNPNQSVKLLLTGDPGYGKTTIAERLAEFLNFTCYRMNCAAIRDTEEWFYDREVKPKIVYSDSGEFLGLGTETLFSDSDFVEILRRGNCVMILDEFNRIESNLHNSLFPLLDDSGSTRLHHKDYIVGPNVIFVATVNLGRENSGTFLLDDALTNRFDMILEVRPLPYDHECAVLKARYSVSDDEADQIVRLATILRENEFKCSTRDTLKIAKIVSVGMPIRDAFEFVIILRIPEDESNAPIRKALVDLVNKQLGTRGVEFAFAS